MTRSRLTLCLLLLAGLTPGTRAQSPGSILPDLTGDALVTALADSYTPSATLPLDEAADSLYVVLDALSSDSWAADAFYSGLFVTFECPPPCDPSDSAYAAGSLVVDPIWPHALGTDTGLALGDLHNLAPVREPIQVARAGLLFGESADTETQTWFFEAIAQSDIPSADVRDGWTEVGSTIEPRELRKGDVARAMFYVYAVYGPAGTDQVDAAAFEAMKETLLFWHESDPPNFSDVSRSQRVSAYQTTVSGEPAINPFAHDPSLVRRAFFVTPVLFVRPEAPAEEVRIPTGTSWSTAFTELQPGMAVSTDHAFVSEIWAAAGTYTPGESQASTFSMRSGLGLYGGFRGTESTRVERSPSTAPTVLSGDIGALGDPSDNVRTILTAQGSEEDRLVGLVVDRVTISDGGTGLNAEFADIDVSDAVFERNRGGSAFASGAYFEQSAVTVRNSRFLDNHGYFSGGLMFYESEGLVSDVHFEGNTSTNGSGGGSILQFSQATLRDLTFVNNSGGSDRIDGKGGGLFIGDSDVILSHSVFRQNVTRGPGGGLAIEGGSLSAANLLFHGNRAGDQEQFDLGGGMSARRADPLILTNTVFVANVADYGAALSVYSRDTSHVSNIIAVANGSYLSSGGAIEIGSAFDEFDLTLVNSIVVGNAQADRAAGGFTFTESGTEVGLSFRDLNTAPNITQNIYLSASILQGGCRPAGFPNNIVTCDGLIEADPMISRPPSAGPDGIWATDDDDLGDLHLLPGSPGVDAGLASALQADLWDLDRDGDITEALPIDVEGNTRVIGSTVDLGAYEGAVPVAAELDERPIGDDFSAAPNPFRGETRLTLHVATSQPVTVAAYDMLGREVATLYQGHIGADSPLTVTFDGRALPTGVYLVRASGASLSLLQRITLVR